MVTQGPFLDVHGVLEYTSNLFDFGEIIDPSWSILQNLGRRIPAKKASDQAGLFCCTIVPIYMEATWTPKVSYGSR
jgi:hypothetical protein